MLILYFASIFAITQWFTSYQLESKDAIKKYFISKVVYKSLQHKYKSFCDGLERNVKRMKGSKNGLYETDTPDNDAKMFKHRIPKGTSMPQSTLRNTKAFLVRGSSAVGGSIRASTRSLYRAGTSYSPSNRGSVVSVNSFSRYNEKKESNTANRKSYAESEDGQRSDQDTSTPKEISESVLGSACETKSLGVNDDEPKQSDSDDDYQDLDPDTNDANNYIGKEITSIPESELETCSADDVSIQGVVQKSPKIDLNADQHAKSNLPEPARDVETEDINTAASVDASISAEKKIVDSSIALNAQKHESFIVSDAQLVDQCSDETLDKDINTQSIDLKDTNNPLNSNNFTSVLKTFEPDSKYDMLMTLTRDFVDYGIAIISNYAGRYLRYDAVGICNSIHDKFLKMEELNIDDISNYLNVRSNKQRYFYHMGMIFMELLENECIYEKIKETVADDILFNLKTSQHPRIIETLKKAAYKPVTRNQADNDHHNNSKHVICGPLLEVKKNGNKVFDENDLNEAINNAASNCDDETYYVFQHISFYNICLEALSEFSDKADALKVHETMDVLMKTKNSIYTQILKLKEVCKNEERKISLPFFAFFVDDKKCLDDLKIYLDLFVASKNARKELFVNLKTEFTSYLELEGDNICA